MENTNTEKYGVPGAEEETYNSRSHTDGFVSSFVLRDEVICDEGSSHEHHHGNGDEHEHHHHGDYDTYEHHHHHHHHHYHRRRKTAWDNLKERIQNNKKVIIKCLGIIVALAIIAILLALISKAQKNNGQEYETDINEDTGAMLYYGNTWYQERTSLETILILGIDKMSEDAVINDDSYINTQQTDLNILVIIDHESKSYTMLQLNRDTMTQVRKLGLNSVNLGYEVMQLALAHTYGSGGKDSCRNTVDAVQKLLYGITIDHYVAFTMDAVAVLNDEVGGVTVTIEDDFSGVNDRFVMGEQVTLSGEEALQFVRARMEMKDDPSNIARMNRQRTYMDELQKLVMEKVAASDSWSLKTLSKVSEYTVTDMTLAEMADEMDSMEGYSTTAILTPEGEAITNEYVEFYVDEESLKEQVIALFYRKSQEE